MSARDDLVVRTFDQQAPGYADGYAGESSFAHSFQIRRERVFELVGNARGGKALDIGCGPGVTVEVLLQRNFEVFGVDASPEMVRECKRRFGQTPRTHFSVGKIEELKFPAAHFDLILCMGVLEYLEDDARALREIARVAKPGGMVILTVPNLWSPYRIWDRAMYRPLYHAASRLYRKLQGRAMEPTMAHKEYDEGTFLNELQSHQLTSFDRVYYNFKLFLPPLDLLFPRLSVRVSRKLESLSRGPLRRLGTGFIVKAVKLP